MGGDDENVATEERRSTLNERVVYLEKAIASLVDEVQELKERPQSVVSVYLDLTVDEA
jgi:DNA-directed RNA polymerase specialized sigma subunit